MDNFYFCLPEEVFFGEGTINNLADIVSQYEGNILLVYGGGSIKKNGIYDSVYKLLNDRNIVELDGVEPNPSIETVNRGVDICRKNDVKLVIAAGGGSSIDCAKAVCAGTLYDGDAWDLVIDGSLVKAALPLIVIPTMAATGSEMDAYAVISNNEAKIKQSLSSRHLIPKSAILDPTYTYSVPAFQVASGVADILSHLFELYFKVTKGAFMQRRMTESMIETCFTYGETAVSDPTNYEAKANILWASEWAINDFLSAGFNGYWSCHPIEHQLSAYYDVTHGAGLASITPVWMRHILNEKSVDIFKEYGVRIFKIDSSLDKYVIANMAIDKTEEYFIKLGLPTKLRDLGVKDTSNFIAMAIQSANSGLDKCYFSLTEQDVFEILNKSF